MDEFARRGGHHELGYSSLRAYALQCTGLSPRFVEESRSMARRLFGAPGLPLLSEALCHGQVSWSAAARVAPVLARCAGLAPERLEDEERAAVDAAATMTVRKLEDWLTERARGWTDDASGSGTGAGTPQDPERQMCGGDGAGHEPGFLPGPEVELEAPSLRRLERCIDGTERELIEATRQLITLMDGPVSDEQFVEALLAEAQGAMLGEGDGMVRALRREASRWDWAAAHHDVIEAHARAQQRARRSAAEATEARVMRLRAQRQGRAGHRETEPAPAPGPIIWDALETLALVELESRVRACAEQIAGRDLQIADAALAFARARGWRRVGWRSQDEYAREELGMSGSGLRAIIRRARTMVELPELRDAVERGRLGLEAAVAIGRVATPDSVDAWVERAARRTVVHLREEVRAVELLARTVPSEGEPADLATDLAPPSAAQLEAVREFERSVASGAWFEELMASVHASAAAPGPGASEPDRQMCGGPALDPGQRAAPRRGTLLFSSGAGQRDDRLRLHISDEQAGWWRYLERAYERHERSLRGRARTRHGEAEPLSFVAFACMAVWMSWYPSIKHTGQYDRWTQVYVRDRYRCSSPVCSRRDVTPHHLRFQAHGGGDETENVASLCSWCHLEGIHGGRITARPPASAIHWRLGRGGGLQVHGRELVGG